MAIKLDSMLIEEAQKYKWGRGNAKTTFIKTIQTVYIDMKIEISEEIMKEFGEEDYSYLEELQDKAINDQINPADFFVSMLEQYLSFEEERINLYIDQNERWLRVRIRNKLKYLIDNPEQINIVWEENQRKLNQERNQ
jgi:hypothetical protein